MIGACIENRLIAFGFSLLPKIDARYIGFELGSHETEFNTIVYQEITIVSPRFRGNGLQIILGMYIMKS